MSWWSSLFGSEEGERRRPDYYDEGVQLLRAGAYHEAVTSFRLALRESPNDLAIHQQIAIAYTRIGMTDEAIRTYRTVLQQNPAASGAHYGLAFLMLKEGRRQEAAEHLRSFLASPPQGADAGKHVAHARETLENLTGETAGGME